MNSARMFLVHFVMGFLPPTRAFGLKSSILRWAGAEVGENVRIASSARFYTGGRLALGAGTWVGHEVLIAGGAADVLIGSNVDIGPRVTIVTGTHEVMGVPGRAAGNGYSKAVWIGEGAWIGAGATILGGSTVGASAIVGACALVRGPVEPREIVAGIPARPLRRGV